MSYMKDQLMSKLPAGMTVPEPLERAWTWMEAQGWGSGEGEDYFLTPYAGQRQMGIVFSADRTLEGWSKKAKMDSTRCFRLQRFPVMVASV